METNNKERDERKTVRLIGSRFSGKWHDPETGDCVYAIVGGKQSVRRYAKPSNPRTEKQVEQRRLFAEVIKAWQVLPADKKTEYNRRARRMSGFNLFVKEYAKDTDILTRFCPT